MLKSAFYQNTSQYLRGEQMKLWVAEQYNTTVRCRGPLGCTWCCIWGGRPSIRTKVCVLPVAQSTRGPLSHQQPRSGPGARGSVQIPAWDPRPRAERCHQKSCQIGCLCLWPVAIAQQLFKISRDATSSNVGGFQLLKACAFIRAKPARIFSINIRIAVSITPIVTYLVYSVTSTSIYTP